MLSISELARHGGVSVRAVRHYHQLGLLPEPPRNELGHRSYGAESLIVLRRITTLAEAGVPLAEIPEVLHAAAGRRAEILAGVEGRLRERERQLRLARRRLAELRDGRDALLPDSIQQLLALLGGLGLDERQLDVERELWQLTYLLYPQLTERWLVQQMELFEDDSYASLYIEASSLLGVDADDPRIVDLARRTIAWAREHAETYREWADAWAADPQASELLEAHSRIRYDSPAHRRLQRLVAQGLADLFSR